MIYLFKFLWIGPATLRRFDFAWCSNSVRARHCTTEVLPFHMHIYRLLQPLNDSESVGGGSVSSLVQQRLYHCKFLTNQTNTLAKTARALAHMYKQLLKLLQLLFSSQGNGHSLALNRDRHHSNAMVIMSIQLLYNGLWIYIDTHTSREQMRTFPPNTQQVVAITYAQI